MAVIIPDDGEKRGGLLFCRELNGWILAFASMTKISPKKGIFR